MRIGVGLPNTVAGTNGTLMVEWARRAEQRGFSFLSTIGRVAYPSYDSLTCLAVAAGATSRIGLLTNVLLGPTYPDAVLAKSALTLSSLSGGRFTLGLGVGARRSDYQASERDFDSRGRAFDQQLEALHKTIRGDPVGGDRPLVPPDADGIPLLLGGHSQRAIRRTVEWGAGWTAAGGGPDRARPMVEAVRQAWHQAGRAGEPRLLGLAYYSIGDDVVQQSDAYLREYYAFAGEHADTIARGAAHTPDSIRGMVDEFAGAGMTELVFTPTVPRLDQVDRLADLVL